MVGFVIVDVDILRCRHQEHLAENNPDDAPNGASTFVG
jgi:hypothetical protein